jgi:hypothetical protein
MISYERNREGAWVLSALVGEGWGEYLLSRPYYFYTKKQATKLFKEEMKREGTK